MTEEARSSSSSPAAGGEAFDRTEEEDHDLLTFGEAGLRLVEAIRELETTVAELERTDAGPDKIAAAQNRLDSLRDASERNSAQPINDENFAKFFGYEGQAKRNTSW